MNILDLFSIVLKVFSCLLETKFIAFIVLSDLKNNSLFDRDRIYGKYNFLLLRTTFIYFPH